MRINDTVIHDDVIIDDVIINDVISNSTLSAPPYIKKSGENTGDQLCPRERERL